MIELTGKSIFHVHTFRCKHAENIGDEAYIKKAVELGADQIWFTDHAPFPGDPFGGRMDMRELPEYIDTLTRLKEKYADKIEVHIGLEAEYFPAFEAHYTSLRATKGIEAIILGQHMFALPDGGYSFSLSPEEKKRGEHIGSGDAIVLGIKSGYFDAVAHPDRIFRRCKEWTGEMEVIAGRIIEAAVAHKIPLEYNLRSVARKRELWEEFWNKVPEGYPVVVGSDAHAIKELIL